LDEKRCGTIRRISDIAVNNRREIGQRNRRSAKSIAGVGIVGTQKSPCYQGVLHIGACWNQGARTFVSECWQ